MIDDAQSLVFLELIDYLAINNSYQLGFDTL